jgi:hypothetical protein
MKTEKDKLRILELARQEGYDPARIPPAVYTRLSLRIRTAPEIVKDGAKMVSSRVRTGAGFRVPLAQAEHNEKVCRANTCGGFGVIGQDRPVCHKCNCHGKNLLSKWRDPRESCPEKLWDNTTAELEKVPNAD